MLQYARSAAFVVQMYVMMPVVGLLFAPLAMASPRWATRACKTYSWWVEWTLGWMVGLRFEIRGEVPDYEALIAAKHQSFLDVMLIFHPLPAGKFIMKRILLWAPVIGLYGMRIGCVPVSRGKRGAAIMKMVADVEAGRTRPGQLIIYPQGTRIAPGVKAPYKVGTAVLYEQLNQPCVPVATNVGVFWPKRGILRKPGLAVVEFLPPIAPGMERAAFMAHLEEVIETKSNALMAEAGFDPDGAH